MHLTLKLWHSQTLLLQVYQIKKSHTICKVGFFYTEVFVAQCPHLCQITCRIQHHAWKKNQISFFPEKNVLKLHLRHLKNFFHHYIYIIPVMTSCTCWCNETSTYFEHFNTWVYFNIFHIRSDQSLLYVCVCQGIRPPAPSDKALIYR